MDNQNQRCVVQVANYSSLYGGNFLASLLELERCLNNSGVRQVYVFPEEARERDWCKNLIASGRTVSFIPTRPDSPKTVKMVSDILRSKNASLVHLHFGYAVAAVYAKRQLKDLIAINHWHSDFPSSLSKIRQVVLYLTQNIKFKLIYNQLFNITVSKSLKDDIISLGCNPNRVACVENGISFDRIRQGMKTCQTRENMRQQLHIPDDAFVVLLLGWMPYKKGADLLINACRSLQTSGKQMCCCIVIRQHEEQEIRQFIMEHCGSSDFPWLRLLPFALNICDYFTMSNVFVSASRYEGFSYSIAEAAYAGLPVVSSDIASVQWARSLPSVTFIPSEDISELINALQRILTMQDELTNDIIISQQVLNRDFSIDRWTQKITKIYLRLLDGGSMT